MTKSTFLEGFREEGRAEGFKDGYKKGIIDGYEEGILRGLRMGVLAILEGRFSEPIPLNLIAYIKQVEHESRLSYFIKLAVKLESLEAFQSAIGE